MNKIAGQKKIAILQSSYIPWKGYFDLINSVDEFIIYDDIEYSHGTWRNRNKIYTPAGIQWMTIPVNIRGESHQNIDEIKTGNGIWAEKHWKTLVQNYGKAPFFPLYKDYIRELYFGCTEKFLSRINYRFITAINKLLGIKTILRWSSEFHVSGKKSKRLIDICKETGATTYLSGPAAKVYIDEELFNISSLNPFFQKAFFIKT